MSKYYNIGRTLRLYRVKAGKTQTDIAEVLNLTKQQISNWERNRFEPKLDTISEYVKACGANMGQFLKDARE